MGTPIIQIMEWNGDSTKTDKTASTVRFKSVDSPAVDSANPLTIPGASRTFSFEKWLRLRIGSGDLAEQLSNLKFYTDGSSGYGTGISLYTEVAPSGAFRSAAAPSTANTVPLGGSGSITMTNVFAYTAAGAVSLSSAAETFSGTATDIGRFLVMVMGVVPGATAGTLSAETLSFSYDTSAAATTAGYTQVVSLNAAIAKTFTTAMSLDSVVGQAVDDGTFDAIVSLTAEFTIAQLLDNDFTSVASEDSSGSSLTTITSVTGFTNGSATLTGTYVHFVAAASGAAAFHYVGDYLGAVSTGSVALAVTEFTDEALILDFTPQVGDSSVTENRSGTHRSTGIGLDHLIQTYASGEQRFTAELGSATGALGLVVEDTGANILTNSNLSGGTTTPTGWSSIIDGTRSSTASMLGDADAALAFKFVAAPVSGGGDGGRPYLNQQVTISSSVTYTQSCIVEFYTGGANSALLGWAGLSSATGTQFVTASQLSSLPQLIQATWMNIRGSDQTAGVRFGSGLTTSVSGSMIISRPMLTRGKSAAQTYCPDATRAPDRPTVALGSSFPYSTAAGSFIVQARTAPYLGNQVLFQVDFGSAGDMQMVYRDISGHLHYVVNQSGTAKADIIWSGVANSTTFRFGIDYSGSSVITLLNSVTTTLTDSTVQLPSGANGTLRLGHDISGNHWNGTIAGFSAYRSTRGLTGGPDTSSGGSGTTPSSQIPLNYYGSGHRMIGLANTSLNVAGRQVTARFRCLRTGVIESVKWYMISSTSRTGYSAYLGDPLGGRGGLIRMRLFANNPNAGAAGTAANVPTSSEIGHFVTMTARDRGVAFPVQTGSANVCAGNVYHVVWQNVHSDPGDNYVSVNMVNAGDDLQPCNIQIPDLYEWVAYRNTSVNTWTRRPSYQHILQIDYADGGVQGGGYMESVLRTTDGEDEGRVSVGGSTQVRQVMVPDETMTLTQVAVWCRKSGTPSDMNLVTRRQSNGFVMDTTSAASSLFSTSDRWMRKDLNAGSIIFSASVTYTLTLTATTGSYPVGGYRDGAAGSLSGGSFDERITVRGRCEKSTNSGSSWTGFTMNSNSNSDQVDIGFFYTRSV